MLILGLEFGVSFDQAVERGNASGFALAQGLAIAGRFAHFMPSELARSTSTSIAATLNQSHQIIIVAAELDPSTERIIGYLNARDIAINVVFFQVFEHGADKLLSRAWLIDPGETQAQRGIHHHGEGRQGALER